MHGKDQSTRSGHIINGQWQVETPNKVEAIYDRVVKVVMVVQKIETTDIQRDDRTASVLAYVPDIA